MKFAREDVVAVTRRHFPESEIDDVVSQLDA